MRIIFSRDRAAQLDLLLRSLERNAPSERTEIIWWASHSNYERGYRELGLRIPTPARLFHKRLHSLLVDEHVTFFTDDDVVFRKLPHAPALESDEVLTFSWRLGASVRPWNWTRLPRSAHGYPGSIDGHTFRTEDVLRMLHKRYVSDPLLLETELVRGAEEISQLRPLMSSFPEQVLVGVPVNAVADQHGARPNGKLYPQSQARLNELFLQGRRISLDRMDFSSITECHQELRYCWQ